MVSKKDCECTSQNGICKEPCGDDLIFLLLGDQVKDKGNEECCAERNAPLLWWDVFDIIKGLLALLLEFGGCVWWELREKGGDGRDMGDERDFRA